MSVLKNKITMVLLVMAFIAVCYVLGQLAFPSYPEHPGYRADIQAKHISGVPDNLSSLTWNVQTQTLFATMNRPPRVVELSPEGRTLRIIPVNGPKGFDPEAIEYLDNDQFIIADERERRLYEIHIMPETLTLQIRPEESMSVGVNHNHNNSGFEGLAFERHQGRFLVAQEKKPVKLITLVGCGFFPRESRGCHIETDTASGWMKHIGDISGLNYDDVHQQLQVLSDESKKIVLTGHDGTVQQISLDKGEHGLQSSVPQPEGIATDSKGRLYVVSEPNLFYRFAP